MRILNIVTPILSAATVIAFMSPQIVVADELVTCKSHDYEFKHCDTRSSPSHVKLHKQLSRADCKQGRTWDYDHHGLWVDDGCKGEFLVESDYDDDDRYDNDRDREDKDDGESMYGIKITRDVKRNSADYKSFDSGSLKKCARACSSDRSCKSFNYGKELSDCHLKSNVVNGVHNTTVVSGIKK